MSIFEELKKGVRSPTAESTIELGRRLASWIPENQVVALEGDLGAGKTTFTKGIGLALGLHANVITSPTFNLYSIHRGSRQLIHIDGYRLESGNDSDELLIEEFLLPPWLIVVEWPDRGLAHWMRPHVWTLRLEKESQQGVLQVRLVSHPYPVDPHSCLGS